jgi:transposase
LHFDNFISVEFCGKNRIRLPSRSYPIFVVAISRLRAILQHQEAVQRLAEVPGLGVNSAHQIIAGVGATVATFPSDRHLASWVGACPGDEESAGVLRNHRSPKGNTNMRRLLMSANAALKLKGSIFQILYRRLSPRLGHNQAIGVVAHKLCRLI